LGTEVEMADVWWEYLVMDAHDADEEQDILTARGRERWELTGARTVTTHTGRHARFYFKRPDRRE
jgi:hypothetical protein